jgi:hypothetical protein
MMEMMPVITGGTPPESPALFEKLLIDVVAKVVSAELPESYDLTLDKLPAYSVDEMKEALAAQGPCLQKLMDTKLTSAGLKSMRRVLCLLLGVAA